MRGKLELENYDWILFKPKSEAMLQDSLPVLFIAKGSKIPLSRISNFGTANIIRNDNTGVWLELY